MRPRSGVALIVVLWTIVLMASITAVASSAARSSARVATNTRATVLARTMAENGIVAATSLVDDSLAAFAGDSAHRDAFFAALTSSALTTNPLVQDSLGDGVYTAAIVDVSARLDVNYAGVDGMTTLLRTVTSEGEARQLAMLIDARVRGESVNRARTGREFIANRNFAANASRDSLTAVLLGRTARPGVRHPFQSLDELLEIPGLDEALLARVAPMLTVDGDGRINRRSAPAVVLAAAAGSLVNRPTRFLVIARGWQRGQALTREIQAVYEIADDGLRLVRWREQGR